MVASRTLAAAALAAAVLATTACKGKQEPAATSGDRTGSGSGSGSAHAAKPPTPPPAPLPPVPLAADPGGATGKVRWAESFGGYGSDAARAIAFGGGQLAVGGFFADECTFGNLGARKSAGGSDAFVVALGPDGQPRWLQTFGAGRDDVVNGVAVAKDGRVLAVGNFLDKLDIAGKKGHATAEAAGSDDLFAAAFTKDGQPDWLWTAGGIYSDGADAAAATPDGGWLVGGSFIEEGRFGPDVYKSKGGHDAILAKLAPTGEVQWVKQMGGAYNDAIQSIAVDGQGNIYVLGEFVDTATFGGPPIANQGNAGSDIAVAKLAPDGTHLWSKGFGSKGNDFAGSIAVDPAGNVTAVGSFEGAIAVGDETYGSVGQYDVVVVHMDPGGAVQWVKTWGSHGTDIGSGVAADASGNVVVTGWFEDSVLIGDKTVSSHGNRDIFAAKLDPKGAVLWVDAFGDHDHDQGRAVAIDADGNPVLAGVYRFKFDGVTPPLESVHKEDDKLPKPDVLVVGLAR